MVDTSLGSSTQRVLLVEGHEPLARLLRETLHTLPGSSLVAEVRSAREAVTAAAEHHPDLIVMDLHLPDLCGFEVVPLLQAANCGTKVILLIEQDDLRYHQAAWQRGVAACVGKDHIARELIPIVRQVLASEPVDVSHLDDHAIKGAS